MFKKWQQCKWLRIKKNLIAANKCVLKIISRDSRFVLIICAYTLLFLFKFNHHSHYKFVPTRLKVAKKKNLNCNLIQYYSSALESFEKILSIKIRFIYLRKVLVRKNMKCKRIDINSWKQFIIIPKRRVNSFVKKRATANVYTKPFVCYNWNLMSMNK